MDPKLHVVTATVLSSLLAAGAAVAQNGQTQSAQGQAPATGQQAGATITCPPGCVPASAVEQARARRRAAARRAARERQRAEQERLAQEQAERERMEQERLAQEQAERERMEQERLAQEQAERERMEQERLAQEQAERERMEQERLAAQPTYVPPPAPARGGGPTVFNPRLTVAIEGGGGGFTGGARRLVHPGPNWGARLGVQLFPFLVVEGRYFGMFNDGFDPRAGNGVGLITNGGTGNVRLIAPIPYVRPYAIAGVGAYHTALTGSAQDRQASNLRRDTYAVVPLGLGAEVSLGEHFSIGVEGNYHALIGEHFTADPTIDAMQSHLWTGHGLLRWTM